MRWSQRGAHLLLQIRTRVLNDDLAGVFHRWYPAFTRASHASSWPRDPPIWDAPLSYPLTILPTSRAGGSSRIGCSVCRSLGWPATDSAHDPVEVVGMEPDDQPPGGDHLAVEADRMLVAVQVGVEGDELVAGLVPGDGGDRREGHGAVSDGPVPEVVAKAWRAARGSRARFRVLSRSAVVEMRTARWTRSGT